MAPTQRRNTQQRHEKLMVLLREGTTHVDDLATCLHVSPSTVRRDLSYLTGQRRVARTYGGALVPEAFTERSIEESAGFRQSAKAAIAQAALRLIPPGETVFLDAGTTCGALADLVAAGSPDDAPGTVVTRGLETASTLASVKHLDLILLGGRIRHLSHAMVGPLTDLALDRMGFSIAFLGADAFRPERGIGEPTLEETRVKEHVAAQAERVVVLADESKLNVTGAPAWTCSTTGWTLITDKAPEGFQVACTRAEVQLLLAR